MSDPTTTRQTTAFAIPLLPGKTDTDRSAMRSCWQGERRTPYESSRKRLGITREAVWIQNTPDGDVAVVHLEADDLQRAFTGMGASDDPFDRWFREHCLDVHGLDLTAGFSLPEQVLHFRS
jgi:hypothetical protein